MRFLFFGVIILGLYCSAAHADGLAPRAVIPFTGTLNPALGELSMTIGRGRVMCALRHGHLVLDPFWFGAISGKADIDLAGARVIDVTLEFLSADLGVFIEMLRARGIKVPLLSGVVTGSLQLKGPMARPYISGRMSAYNGQLKGFSYETFDLKFEGTYPHIRLEEGMVVSSEGPNFKVAGALDLSDMSGLGGQLSRDFVISDDDSGRAWVFRRLQGAGNHTTQLKSFLSGNADGRGEGNGVIGLQKHIGF
jgi:hypothetical protein